MGIIKDAVKIIEDGSNSPAVRDFAAETSVSSGHSDRFSSAQDPRTVKEALSPDDLSNKRIYHAAMRDERVHKAFTNLRTHVIQRTGKRSCSIVVTAMTPGGGASFVALNLAAAFASDSSGSAILMDCDFSGRRYDELGDDESQAGITEFVDGTAISLTPLLVDVGIPNLRLLGGGRLRGPQREIFTRPRARLMFQELGSHHPDAAVIVDAPPTLLSANANVIANYCDAVLLVVPYGKAGSQDVRAAIRSIPPGKLVGSVFNNVPHWRNNR